MINSLAICFDGQGLREFELKNGVRVNSRIDDCNFELTSVSFNPVFLLSFFLSFPFFFFFTLHTLRSIERDLMRSRTGRHYEIHLPSLPGGKANERK